jgi:hypothetical protein
MSSLQLLQYLGCLQHLAVPAASAVLALVIARQLTFVIAARHLRIVSDASRSGFGALINLTPTPTRNPNVIKYTSYINANQTERAA